MLIHLRIDNTYYKVNPSGNSLASIIAYALLKEPQAAQLVARFGGDNLEMEKDWEIMSEFDKDKIELVTKTKLFGKIILQTI